MWRASVIFGVVGSGADGQLLTLTETGVPLGAALPLIRDVLRLGEVVGLGEFERQIVGEGQAAGLGFGLVPLQVSGRQSSCELRAVTLRVRSVFRHAPCLPRLGF